MSIATSVTVQEGQREGHPSQKGNLLPSTEILDPWTESCIPSSATVSPSNSSPHASPAELEYAPSGPSHALPIEQGGLTLEQLKKAMNADATVQEDLIPILCEMLEMTVQWNDKATARQTAPGLQAFEGDTMPTSVTSYVRRILKYSRCSTCCLVVGLIYLERMKMQQQDVRLTSSNLQRLLLVATMEAAKYLDDFYYSNWHWARMGGITVREINDLELDFLFELTFDVCVSPEQYKSFVRGMLDVDDKNIDGLLSFVSDSQAHIITAGRRCSLMSPQAELRLASKVEHVTSKDPQAKAAPVASQRKPSISELYARDVKGLDCDECGEVSAPANVELESGLIGPQKLMSKEVELSQHSPTEAPKKKEIVVGILGRTKFPSVFKRHEGLKKQQGSQRIQSATRLPVP